VPAGTLFTGGIGYISLNPVSESSAAETAGRDYRDDPEGMKSMIFDLRGNPGGLLDQGVKVADLFLNPRQEIVSTKGRARNSSKEFFDDARQQWPDLPIIVLVNEGSASAAEIIAGRCRIMTARWWWVRRPSARGLVQTLFHPGRQRRIEADTARWYTPSGRTIQRVAKGRRRPV
jgi:carboxyl-terminal processing protease